MDKPVRVIAWPRGPIRFGLRCQNKWSMNNYMVLRLRYGFGEMRLVGSVQFVDGRTLGRRVSDGKSRESSSHG